MDVKALPKEQGSSGGDGRGRVTPRTSLVKQHHLPAAQEPGAVQEAATRRMAEERERTRPEGYRAAGTQERHHRSGGGWKGSQIPAVPAQEGSSQHVADQPEIVRFRRRAGS